MNHRVTSKNLIIEQAMEIALSEGVDHVSIRKLATACGIAIGSVYNYFPNKEALIIEISEQFWSKILENQDKVYRKGMGFISFLEQYYLFLNGRLSAYDKSWLMEMSGITPERKAIDLLHQVLMEDPRINAAIWNMDLNEEAFCEYVLTNIMALLKVGENNCRFFIFLIEHLLYSE